MILCDTNILIEAYRNNPQIADRIKRIDNARLAVSDITCIELFYGAKNKHELRIIGNDLKSWNVLPIQSEMSAIAVELVKTYCLSHKLSLGDALIAATAICLHIELYMLNVKDFVFIPNLKLYQP
ncbi:MAG: type II toxin-antitoxin system VapC family toxin [Tannerellaceae bacterium]|jgi:predicted nucleic acid-binding protein|nr:type II toxin-antitoxin system VapC family toxin [Tannerellaceae bacterium]